MFLKVPVIIIMRFGDNNVLCVKYINIYEFRGVRGGRTYTTVHFLFIIKKKTKKVQEHDIYLKEILHYFDLIFFSIMSNKKFTKREGPSSYFFTK